MKANSASPNYSLTVQLATADSVNSWFIDCLTEGTADVDISDGAEHPCGPDFAYGEMKPRKGNLQIPFSNSSGSIGNTLGK